MLHAIVTFATACVLPLPASTRSPTERLRPRPTELHPSGPARGAFAASVPHDVIDEAEFLYERHLRRKFASIDQAALGAQQVPCRSIDTDVGRFFVMRPGLWHSDICWISADDDAAFAIFEDWLSRSTLAEQLASAMDCSDKPVLYNGYFVVRRGCSGVNMHTDFVDAVGTNAFTVMTPLRDYRNADNFQLVYLDDAGSPQQYRYRRGEALCFGAWFQHSTEPGQADPADGVHCYLCFTFGSDKKEYWPLVLETQGGYAARVLRGPDRTEHVTGVGRFLQDQEQ